MVADLIVQAFSSILQKIDETASSALITSCFLNIVGSLKLLTPTHAAFSQILQAISQCMRSPGTISQIGRCYKTQMQLGQAFQAIFASHSVNPGVQELAIQMAERLFLALSESQRAVFLNELFIVDWLLEAVRNKSAVAHLAIKSLEKNFSKSSSFLQEHFESSERPSQRPDCNAVLELPVFQPSAHCLTLHKRDIRTGGCWMRSSPLWRATR